MSLFCASDENFFVQKEFLFPKELGKVAAEPEYSFLLSIVRLRFLISSVI